MSEREIGRILVVITGGELIVYDHFTKEKISNDQMLL
jgi:hypothetical protein